MDKAETTDFLITENLKLRKEKGQGLKLAGREAYKYPSRSVKHLTASKPSRSFGEIGESFTKKSGAFVPPSLFQVVP